MSTGSSFPRVEAGPSGRRLTHLRTGSSFLRVEADAVFDTPAQLREQVVGSALSLALAAVVGANLGGAGNIGYAVADSALKAVCFGVVFRCAFDPQRHAAWLAPGTWTLHAFLVATSALGVGGAYLFASVNTDRLGSGSGCRCSSPPFIYNIASPSSSTASCSSGRTRRDRGLFFTGAVRSSLSSSLGFSRLRRTRGCMGPPSVCCLVVGLLVCTLKIDKAHTTGSAGAPGLSHSGRGSSAPGPRTRPSFGPRGCARSACGRGYAWSWRSRSPA